MSYTTIRMNLPLYGATGRNMECLFSMEGIAAFVEGVDVGVHVNRLGEVEWSFDLEALNVTNGRTKLTIADTQRYIWQRLFALLPEYTSFTKQLGLVLERWDVSDYVLHFAGQATSASYNYAAKLFDLTITAVDKFNTGKLYNDDGSALNPLGYTAGTHVLLTTIISDIFAAFDPALSVLIDCDWVFNGQFDATEGPVLVACLFPELQMYVNDIFWNSTNTMKTLGDVLRNLAFEFGCYCGISPKYGFFFQSIHAKHATRFKPLNEAQILSVVYSTLAPVPFIRVESTIEGAAASIGTEGNAVYENTRNSIDRKLLVQYMGYDYVEQTNLRVTKAVSYGGVETFGIKEAASTVTGSSPYIYSEMVPKFWYNFRNNADHLQLVTIELFDWNIDILDEPVWNGVVYRILQLSIDLSRNVTTIEMIPIGVE